MTMNQYGLTFRRWLAAAGVKLGGAHDKKLRAHWLAGVDPSEMRATVGRTVRKIKKVL